MVDEVRERGNDTIVPLSLVTLRYSHRTAWRGRHTPCQMDAWQRGDEVTFTLRAADEYAKEIHLSIQQRGQAPLILRKREQRKRHVDGEQRKECAYCGIVGDAIDMKDVSDADVAATRTLVTNIIFKIEEVHPGCVHVVGRPARGPDYIHIHAPRSALEKYYSHTCPRNVIANELRVVRRMKFELEWSTSLNDSFRDLMRPLIDTIPGNTMTIYVKALTGKTISARVRPETTTDDLRVIVYIKENIPPNLQRLIFAGRQLGDQSTLASYDIKNGSTLQLVLRLI